MDFHWLPWTTSWSYFQLHHPNLLKFWPSSGDIGHKSSTVRMALILMNLPAAAWIHLYLHRFTSVNCGCWGIHDNVWRFMLNCAYRRIHDNVWKFMVNWCIKFKKCPKSPEMDKNLHWIVMFDRQGFSFKFTLMLRRLSYGEDDVDMQFSLVHLLPCVLKPYLSSSSTIHN